MSLPALRKSRLEEIEALYFAGLKPVEISRKLKIPLPQVRVAIYGEDETGSDPKCMFHVKSCIDPNALSVYIAEKVHVLERITAIGLEIVQVALNNTLEQARIGEVELSIDETRKLTGVVKDINEINRLEKGEATSIVETQDYSGYSLRDVQEARAKLRAKPIVEADYEELDDDD